MPVQEETTVNFDMRSAIINSIILERKFWWAALLFLH
jgi:hypothetical protein